MIDVTTQKNVLGALKHTLIGKPLATEEAPHQTISKKVGLAVFASDALSSTAYATEAILEVLAFAVPVVGSYVLGYSIYIALGIVFLLAVVTISYQQTVHAYPGGGGAYIVARDNLGELPAQTAGAALLTDYILTVAVSISSGVAQLTSGFPALYPYRILLAVGIVVFMTIMNLRGVKESGSAFAIPTYFFLVITIITIGTGFIRYVSGTLAPVTGVTPAVMEATRGLGLFLILRAFSSGCTALTGVEAISNGITAFKEPKSTNAGTTLIWMSVILGIMFISITFLADQIGAQFSWWVVVLLIPTLVFIFFRIHHHYRFVACNLSLEKFGEPPRILRNRVIIPIGGVHSGVIHALRYAHTFSNDITAVYVAVNPAQTKKIKEKWAKWGDGVRLKIIESPYRTLMEPLIEYIDQMAQSTSPTMVLSVVVPEFIPEHNVYKPLHMNTAEALRKALINKYDIVIMDVPYHIGAQREAALS